MMRSSNQLETGIVTSSLTTVGALKTGSIVNGFGSIDIGNNEIKANQVSVQSRLKVGTMQITNFEATYNFPNNLCFYDFSNESNLGFDSSGNDNFLEAIGPIYVENLASMYHCLYFNQTTDNGTLNQRLQGSLQFMASITALSISVWVYPTTSHTLQDIVSLGNDVTVCLSQLFPRVRVRGTNHTSVVAITANQWSHLVVTFGETGVQLFVNNVLRVSSTNAPVTFASGANSLFIGCSSGLVNPCRQLYLASVSVWNKTLTSLEISRLFEDNYGYDVVVLAGQSNMVGRAALESGVDDNLTALQDRVYQFPFDQNVNSSGVVQTSIVSKVVTLPLDFISNVPGGSSGEQANTTSIWKTFCESIISYIPAKRRILLVPAAKGGIGFEQNNWTARTGAFYTAMVNATNAALSVHPTNKIIAFLWHQGESDAATNFKYGAFLAQFYNCICADISGMSSNVPFLMGEIYENANENNININKVLRSFGVTGTGRYVVSANGLTTTDDVHFDTASIRAFGTLYGESFIHHYHGTLCGSSCGSTTNIQTQNLSVSAATIGTLTTSAVVCNVSESYDTNRILPFPPHGVNNDAGSAISHSYCSGTVTFTQSAGFALNTKISFLFDQCKDTWITSASNTYNGTTGIYSGSVNYFGNYQGVWFRILFPEKFLLKYVTLLGTEELNIWRGRMPLQYRIYGGNNPTSTNLADWRLLVDNVSTYTNVIYHYWDLSSNATGHNAYLMIVRTKYQLDTGITSMGFTELQLLGNPLQQHNLLPRSQSVINKIGNYATQYLCHGNSNWFKSSFGENTSIFRLTDTNFNFPSNHYMMQFDDDIICVHNTTTTNPVVRLLDSRFFQRMGKVITIKDISGNAGTYNISIQSINPTDTVDGSAFPLLINTNYGLIRLLVTSLGRWNRL